MRGFDIRGVGPRVIRRFYDTSTPTLGDFLSGSNNNSSTDDALGGTKYYLGHLELELPLGSGGRELGLRPSIFVDAGAVWGGRRPVLTPNPEPGRQRTDANGAPLYQAADGTLTTSPTTNGTANTALVVPPFLETYFGNSAKPRLSVGFGVNWNSPFGPFRIDIAKALLKEPGDDTKLFSFNVGTQF